MHSVSRIFSVLLCLFALQLYGQAPSLDWARSFVGIGINSTNSGGSVVIDSNGNHYVTGEFNGLTDFDPGAGTFHFNGVNSGGYIVKLSPTGNFLWAKTITASTNIIAMDASQNIIVGGSFSGTVDFDPGPGTFNLSAANSDVYCLKLDPTGDFLWAKSWGGSWTDFGYDVSTDIDGNIFISGSYLSDTVDFDPGPGTHIVASHGFQTHEPFVLKLKANGDFDWVFAPEGTFYTSGVAVQAVADALNNSVYIVGGFSDTMDFDPGTGVFNLVASDTIFEDAFIVKLDTSGNFVWVKTWGDYHNDRAESLGLDSSNNIYISTSFEDTVDFDPGPGVFNVVALDDSASDLAILKLDANGDFLWVKTIANQSWSLSASITVSATDGLFVFGNFSDSLDVDPGNPTYFIHSNGSQDPFIFNLDYTGNFNWARSYGGPSIDRGSGTYDDNSGAVVSVGYFYDTVDFDPDSSEFHLINQTLNRDSYIQKLGPCAITSSIDSIVACDSIVWIDSNTYTSSNNFASYSLTNSAGCDSVIHLALTILTSSDTTFVETVCDSYHSPSGNFNWTTSGTYFDTIASVSGCDSILTIDLTVFHSTFSTISEFVCDTYTSPSGNYIWTSNGTHHDTIPNALGCDSIITVDLVVNTTSFATIEATTCDTLLSPAGNTIWTASGTYIDTIPNALGCDSIITTHLIVDSIQLSVTSFNEHLFAATNDTATFSWWDCHLQAVVPGENSSVYHPDSSGSFLAIAHFGDGCTDTSECHEVIRIIGINENTLTSKLKVYPNPTSGQFLIDWGEKHREVHVTIRNLLGQEISFGHFENVSVIETEINAADGVYFIEVKTGNRSLGLVKVIKE